MACAAHFVDILMADDSSDHGFAGPEVSVPKHEVGSWHAYSYISDMLHVWNIYQHVPKKSPKCR